MPLVALNPTSSQKYEELLPNYAREKELCICPRVPKRGIYWGRFRHCSGPPHGDFRQLAWHFNKEFIPIFLQAITRIKGLYYGGGLACGALWTVCKGIAKGDIVLCPNGTGSYLVGEVAGDYYYKPGETLPHRRPVSWSQKTVERSQMGEPLQNSSGSVGTVNFCDY